MRDHYHFSNGVRGKYEGKVDTSDLHVLGSLERIELAGGVKANNGAAGSCDLDSEIHQKRVEMLVGTLRKRAGGESLLKFLKRK